MTIKRRKINGVFSVNPSGSSVVPFDSNLLPENDNIYDIGSSSLRWKVVNGVTGIFSSIAGLFNELVVTGNLTPSSSFWRLGSPTSVWGAVYGSMGLFAVINNVLGSGTPINFLCDIITGKVHTDALEHRSGSGSTITVNSPTSFSSTVWCGGIGIRPLINDTISLGEAALLWTEMWCTRVYTAQLRPLLTVINCFGHLKPFTTDYDMGDSGTPWRQMFSTRYFAYPDNENGVVVSASNYTGTNRFYACSHSSITRFYVNGDGDCFNLTGVYGTISDKKVKKNIVDSSSVLDKVKKIGIKNYDLVTDVENNSSRCGFIAQDLQKIFPELVTSSKLNEDDIEETMAVSSSLLIPILIKAIQELEQKINKL